MCVFLQEFLDALPVHQFVRTRGGWRERLVDVEPDKDEFRLALAPSATPGSAMFASWLTQSQADTSAWLEGDVREFCPEALGVTTHMTRLLSSSPCGGVALLIDYGDSAPTRPSVRGIRAHQFVSMLDAPGDVDLSADVNFGDIAAIARMDTSQDIHVCGPVGQGAFLKALGLDFRLQRLLATTQGEPCVTCVLCVCCRQCVLNSCQMHRVGVLVSCMYAVYA